MSYIGERVPRREDTDLLTGAARTVADMRLPGTEPIGAGSPPPQPGSGCARPLELAFARSPLPHARVVAVAAAPAREVAGVHGAWSAADLPALGDTCVPAEESMPDWPALATDTVRYPGQALAVVAGTSRAVAEDGVALIDPELDPLPVLADAAAATAPGAPRLFPDRDNVVAEWHLGRPAPEVFASAPVVVEASYREQLLLPTPLEPRAILIRPRDGGLVVWASHQAQHRLRDALARALGMAPAAVRVIVPATGGAFGSKSQTYPEYLAAAVLARHLNRPVRWCEDRAEAMLAATRGRGQHQRVRLAAREDGTLLAYEVDIDADIGGYPHTGTAIPMLTAMISTGPYRTPHVYAHVRAVLTTTVPTAAYRGAGRPEGAYALERTVDLLARRLGLDPADLRRHNYIQPEEFPYHTPTGARYDSGDYPAALDKALDAVGYPALREEQARRRRAGERPLGIGIASYVERSGGPPDSDEYGGVEACADGTFVARVGSTATGQGHLTSFAQVVASALEVDIARVRVIEADTAEVPYGYATFGSRSMQIGGAALWQAARDLVQEARLRYAEELGVPPDDVSYHAGQLRAREATSPLGALVRRTGPLRAERRFVAPSAFPFGTYVAVVEVDPELGTVDVRRLVAVDDYGVVVNPTIVDGQGYGSIAQGLGQALYEQALYRPDGTPYARTLLDYLLPTAAELPPVTLLETRTPNPDTPLGAKGAGEAGCIGTPPAVVNAVCDALSLDHIDMPLTPDAVWTAVRRHAATGVAGAAAG